MKRGTVLINTNDVIGKRLGKLEVISYNGNYYEFDKSILPDITITTDDAIITYGDSSNYIYISKNKTSTPISPEGILINGGGN